MPVMHQPFMHCLTCDYDLRGLPENRCPECGRAFDPGDLRTFAAPAARPTSTVLLDPLKGALVLLICTLSGQVFVVLPYLLAARPFGHERLAAATLTSALSFLSGLVLLGRGHRPLHMLLSCLVVVAIEFSTKSFDLSWAGGTKPFIPFIRDDLGPALTAVVSFLMAIPIRHLLRRAKTD